MNQKVDYVPDHSGLAGIGKSKPMQDGMVRAAQAGLAWAQANSPVQSGAYRDAHRVEPVLVESGTFFPGRGFGVEVRAGARLVNDAPHEQAVEQKHHVLRNAVDVIKKGL